MSANAKPLITISGSLGSLGFLFSFIKGLFSGSLTAALSAAVVSAFLMSIMGVGIFLLLKKIMPELFEVQFVAPNMPSTPSSTASAGTSSESKAGEAASAAEPSKGSSASSESETSESSNVSPASEATQKAQQARKNQQLAEGEIDVEGVPIENDRGKMAQVIQQLMDQDED